MGTDTFTNLVSLSDQKKFRSVIVQNDDQSSTIKNKGNNNLVVSSYSTVIDWFLL